MGSVVRRRQEYRDDLFCFVFKTLWICLYSLFTNRYKVYCVFGLFCFCLFVFLLCCCCCCCCCFLFLCFPLSFLSNYCLFLFYCCCFCFVLFCFVCSHFYFVLFGVCLFVCLFVNFNSIFCRKCWSLRCWNFVENKGSNIRFGMICDECWMG